MPQLTETLIQDACDQSGTTDTRSSKMIVCGYY